jgi:hypothetical protein
MMRRRIPLQLCLTLLLVVVTLRAQTANWLSAPQPVAPGVEYFTSTDQTLGDPAGLMAVYLLKLDPARVRIDSALSNDEVLGRETVDSIAKRHHAIAAINGGFFNTKTGEPAGLAKVAGELVSDTSMTRGAVAIHSPQKGKTDLEFDQISAHMSLRFKSAGPEARDWLVPIAGVDTTRERGKLMVYTPSYHADTDTAGNGTEWVLGGKPLSVREIRVDVGHTPIPRDGAVLSYGGLALPFDLAALRVGTRVDLETSWTTVNGVAARRLEQADHIVNGAGLLRLAGHQLTDWAVEALSATTFTGVRHPRTLIGVDDHGFVWLVAIDGRQPEHSVGMTFAELQRLCDRLHLRDALNLDGGGSTTMVVGETIVNKPSDAAGPRPVSDAILVSKR